MSVLVIVEAIVTIAEQLRQEGRIEGEAKGEARGIAKGEARGIAKGEAKGRRDTLTKLLTLKFGGISEQDRARIESASAEDLDRYTERVLTADTIAAVFA